MSTHAHEAKIVSRVEAREKASFWKRKTYWSVQVARNGEIVYTSEVYTTPQKRDQTARQAASQLGVQYAVADEHI